MEAQTNQKCAVGGVAGQDESLLLGRKQHIEKRHKRIARSNQESGIPVYSFADRERFHRHQCSVGPIIS